jgi:hypothetical protein
VNAACECFPSPDMFWLPGHRVGATGSTAGYRPIR